MVVRVAGCGPCDGRDIVRVPAFQQLRLFARVVDGGQQPLIVEPLIRVPQYLHDIAADKAGLIAVPIDLPALATQALQGAARDLPAPGSLVGGLARVWSWLKWLVVRVGEGVSGLRVGDVVGVRPEQPVLMAAVAAVRSEER